VQDKPPAAAQAGTRTPGRVMARIRLHICVRGVGRRPRLRTGNGREWGQFGFGEPLEVKAVLGHTAE